MSNGPRPDYRSCQHYVFSDEAEITLVKGRLMHRLYGNRLPQIAKKNEEDRTCAGIRFPGHPEKGDWLVCLASVRERGGNIKTWPEWTWGATRHDIPVWFRGEDFKGQVRSPKSDWLISSLDVESFFEQLAWDKPPEIVAENHHEEENKRGRMVHYMTFSWNGSIQTLKPSGWLVPLKAAARRLKIPVKE